MARIQLNIFFKELHTKDFWVCLFAELLATFFFVFLTTGSAIVWDKTRPPTIEHVSLSFGLSIATLAMSILHISGGLINPAVSVAQMVTRKLSVLRGIGYIIVQSGGGSAIVWDPNRPPTIEHVSLSFGLSIATLAMSILHISGGLINPAVSVAQMVARKFSVLRGIGYIIVQSGGGIAGSALLYILTPESKRGVLGATVPVKGVSVGQAFGIEFVLTFLLVLTVFACTDPKREHYGYEVPLAIGFCVVVCHLIGIRYTGCGINPARSLGPAVMANVWTDHWVYWVAPISGAVVAAGLYQLLFLAEDNAANVNLDQAGVILSNITSRENENGSVVR